MADRWMDERDRQFRDGDWRRTGPYGRDPRRPDPSQMGGADREGEDRSWREAGERGFIRRDPQPYRRDIDYGADRRSEHLARGGQPAAEGDAHLGAQDYLHGYRTPRRYYGSPTPGSYESGYRASTHDDGRDAADDFLYRAGRKVARWFGGDWQDGRGSNRGLGPKDFKRSDERISDDIHEVLTDDHWLDASGVSVAVSAGDVTLSGYVPDRESKHRTERLVEQVRGVNHVQNNLRIGQGGDDVVREPDLG